MRKFFSDPFVIVMSILIGLAVVSVSLGQSPRVQAHQDTDTGCEYLVTAEGGITPRLNSKGKHICTKP